MTQPGTPDILRIAEEYQRRLRASESAAVRQMAQGYGRLAKDLAGRAADLAAEVGRLEAAGETVAPWQVAQLERYRDLLGQAQRELARLGEGAAETIADLQRQGLELGMDMADAQVTALIPPGIRIAFNRLPIGALEAMVGFLQDGSPLARLLADLGEETGRRIGELLQKGLGLGWNPRKVAAAIRQEVGMALSRAMRIARTEMLRAWRKSSIQGYRDQGSLIKGYRRHCQQDTRTCVACLLLDGKFYEVGEDFTDHVQGRCAVIPVTRSWAELGFPDIPDTNPEWEPGRDWLLAQDETGQRAIMGNALYDAWRAGEIGLDDMATLHRSAQWGDSWQAASVPTALASAGARARSGG